MSDIHALTGAYAVDALDDQERALFEKHLEGCATCRVEVAELQETAALLAEVISLPADPELRDRVLTGIEEIRPLPPLTPPALPPVPAATTVRPAPLTPPVSLDQARSARRRRAPLLLAAAAAVIAIVGVGAAVTQPWSDDPTSQVPSAADQVRQATDAETWEQAFPDGSAATITRSKSLNKAIVETSDMAPAPDGHVYQMWLNHEDVGMVSAGVMPAEADATLVLDGDPATAVGAGISVEPAGGSTTPSDDIVALFEFDSAR